MMDLDDETEWIKAFSEKIDGMLQRPKAPSSR